MNVSTPMQFMDRPHLAALFLFLVRRNSKLATGYFLWDIYVCYVHYEEIGFEFTVHALSCFLVYLISLAPFIMYYTHRVLLFELSTIFLNNLWYMDKTGLGKSSFLYISNIVFLIATFFCSRLVWGFQTSYLFFLDVFENIAHIPKIPCIILLITNLILYGLNIFWFSKMLLAIKRRLLGKNEMENKENK
jgi:hypothetical protein